jgi:tRNA(adenine34) deaminase
MLLPVGAAFGPLSARPVEFAFAAFLPVAVTVPRVAVAIPPRAVKLRTISTIELRPLAERPIATGPVTLHPVLASARKPRAFVTATLVARTVKAWLVETRPLVAVATFALLPRLGLAARRTVAEVLARAVAEFAVGETSLAALATRRTITTIEFRTVAAIELRAISARLEVPLLAIFTIEPRRARPISKFPVGETAFAALATRRSIAIELWTVALLEFRAIPARLEIPLFATGTVVAVEARRARPVAKIAAGCGVVIPAARRTAVAVAAIGPLAALALAKPALGELLLRSAGGAGTALAAGRTVTPAAGIVVFVVVAGHERSHFGWSNGGVRARHEAQTYAKPESTFAEGPSSNRFPLAIRGMNAPSFMDLALKSAEMAEKSGEVPIGCVIVRDGEVIATAGNRTLTDRDPTAHAEMLAIRQAAAKIGSERLVDCDLYVTLEPCTMCAAAISFARIRRLYYGAADPKGGAVDSGVRFFASPTCHHAPEVYPSVGEREAATLLKDFFKARR